ncbi:aminoglycoside 3'-phosphotransferase/choline kinase family protein [Bradyrhizobium ontarionense]|uniref:Aminoglycoside 3'-phosphotransferase/choline kinase family protein n=1 Tax=Bradyrhizobium ontarionense TaxID=2898149 RepID=A0ABY3R7X7_9BRAD|nr:aminoglycoside 3'-phosphotransferase/choline kinase family protein [Bradyrhizobium sp. A19]UFZ02868.1 aminoglycoside 3'-phosphotransferase/choline kinase family protein [Bradyrhizobium sp. A19]
MMALPPVADGAQLQRLRADEAGWLPAGRDIAVAHGYGDARLVAFAAGTNLVAALNDGLILKVFPPFHRGKFLSERATLRVLARRLAEVATPELLHEGERDGWFYLIMTRLDGIPASDVWPQLSEPDRQHLLRQVGRVIGSVQRIPPGELLTLGPRWSDFLQAQMAGCHARHQRLGLPQTLLAGLDDLLQEAAVLLPPNPQPVILTGEYIPENFLVEREGGGWRVSGLFDFGDVMAGFGEYDLLGPSAFMAAGHPGRVRALFEGYGFAPADISWQLKRRLLALMMLHQASDPVRHICIPDWPSKVRDFDELQALIWPD